jgi:peroxiredoxin Q/BCP
MNTLNAGDKAPMFKLEDQNGDVFDLAETLKTKQVLVYFYPKAMTPGCTVQAQNLRDVKQQLEELNTIAVGISPDAVKRLTKFTERDGLNFPLLSDEDHKVADDFGVWGLKKFMGKEYDGIHRLTFLVGQDGTIKHFFNKFKTKDHHEVVLSVLEQLAK